MNDRMDARGDKPRASFLSREQIIEATQRCLAEYGYEKSTIRRIAGTLDCAIGSIYRYFRDKNDLLLAVTQDILAPVAREIEAGSPPQQTARTYLRLARERRESYQLMFWLSCLVKADQAAPVDPAQPPIAAHLGVLPGVVIDIIDAWTLQLGDRDQAIRLWTSLHGSAMLDGGAPAIEVGPERMAKDSRHAQPVSPTEPQVRETVADAEDAELAGVADGQGHPWPEPTIVAPASLEDTTRPEPAPVVETASPEPAGLQIAQQQPAEAGEPDDGPPGPDDHPAATDAPASSPDRGAPSPGRPEVVTLVDRFPYPAPNAPAPATSPSHEPPASAATPAAHHEARPGRDDVTLL